METTPSVQRLKFAKSHGYIYVGNGWFRPTCTPVTIGEMKRIDTMSIHEIINLKSFILPLAVHHSIHIMVYIQKRKTQSDYYTRSLYEKQY